MAEGLVRNGGVGLAIAAPRSRKGRKQSRGLHFAAASPFILTGSEAVTKARGWPHAAGARWRFSGSGISGATGKGKGWGTGSGVVREVGATLSLPRGAKTDRLTDRAQEKNLFGSLQGSCFCEWRHVMRWSRTLAFAAVLLLGSQSTAGGDKHS